MNLKLKPFLLPLALTACGPVAEKSADKPNIVVILLDDAGYADFGFMGSKDLPTPNIDRLASRSVIFSDAHVSASVSGPSRAGLLTGRYQQRFGYECNPPAVFPGMDIHEQTMADVLRQAGYTTSAFGKWHLGYEPPMRPNSRGFDYFWGFLAGGRSYFPNPQQDQPGTVHSIRENDVFTTFEGYLTDVLGDKLIEFIEENKKDPFFVYWAPTAPHTPLEATPEDLQKFEGHPRQMLAAMTWSLDRTIGNITDKLEKEGLLDNTLIFFLSDNGGAHNNSSNNYPLKGWKGNKFEAGHRVPFFVHWPAKFNGGWTFDGLTSSLDIFATVVDAAAGVALPANPLDGVSLIPFLKGEKTGNPHEKLFFRKDQMAAVRSADYKLIRVTDLGYRLYDLSADLSETRDLVLEQPGVFESLRADLEEWEAKMIAPLWIEEEEWNIVTRKIHEDLFENREIRVKQPSHLRQLLAQ